MIVLRFHLLQAWIVERPFQEGVMNLGLGTKEVIDVRLTRALRPSWRHWSPASRNLKLQTNELSSRGLKICEKEKSEKKLKVQCF